MSKEQLTDKDLNNLALFFDQYLRDDNDIDKELTDTVNKIFNITHWFSDYGLVVKP